MLNRSCAYTYIENKNSRTLKTVVMESFKMMLDSYDKSWTLTL